jgi:mediator of RNA polymerase II transcription subunit 4
VCCRELIENTIAQKHQKLSSSEHLLITGLLVAKDNELKEAQKLANEQAKIKHKMEALKREVERQDQYIQQLQRQLKEAEQILVSGYQHGRNPTAYATVCSSIDCIVGDKSIKPQMRGLDLC